MIQQTLATAIAKVVQQLYGVTVEIELSRPEEQFGDFTTNVALQLSKQLGKSPRDIADALAEELQAQPESVIQALSVAGPGFINLTVTDAALRALQQATPTQSLAGKVVVTEYSDPNPFKVLHAGHLYTTIIGDVISNLCAVAGAKVARLNFGGDVGLHVGKTMWAMIQTLGGELPEKLADIAAPDRLDWLSECYVRGTQAYEDDPAATDAIVDCNKRVYGLYADNDHDSPFAQLYWTGRTWSYEGFERLYRQLQVTAFDRYLPESEVQIKGTEMVHQGLDKGIFSNSEGAVIYEGEKDGLHSRVFLNSQGLPTYEAKDLGLAATKWQDYQFDMNIIITANDIVDYMRVVLAALSHFYPEAAERTKHLTHGVIKLAGGVKMSSRKGNILRAQDVLAAAEAAQVTAMGSANQSASLGAVKYAFLKQRTGGDIVYDPEESVSILGNSGPYLQYAHARARSVLSKAATHQPVHEITDEPLDSAERALLRKIGQYAEAVDNAVSEMMPHHVCTYLYELAQTFNRFYEQSRVLGDPREALRLELVDSYANVLKTGLTLLGIPAPEKM